jgi:hypothetical protein
MVIHTQKQGFKLTIAAWAMAADALDVHLSELDNVKQGEMIWQIIANAARYYNAEKGLVFGKRSERRLKRKLLGEQYRKQITGSKHETSYELLIRKIGEAAAEEKKKTAKITGTANKKGK